MLRVGAGVRGRGNGGRPAQHVEDGAFCYLYTAAMGNSRWLGRLSLFTNVKWTSECVDYSGH